MWHGPTRSGRDLVTLQLNKINKIIKYILPFSNWWQRETHYWWKLNLSILNSTDQHEWRSLADADEFNNAWVVETHHHLGFTHETFSARDQVLMVECLNRYRHLRILKKKHPNTIRNPTYNTFKVKQESPPIGEAEQNVTPFNTTRRQHFHLSHIFEVGAEISQFAQSKMKKH